MPLKKIELIEITLADKETLTSKFKKLGVLLSEYCFGSVYLFKHIHKYHLLSIDPNFIYGVRRDKVPFIMPLQRPQHWSLEICDYLKRLDIALYPIPSDWIGESQLNYQAAESDYLYSRDEMCAPKNRSVIKKLKKFTEIYHTEEVVSQNLNDRNVSEAKLILRQWQQDINLLKSETDYFSCDLALNQFENLDLLAKVYYLKSAAYGFLIAEKVADDTLVVHFGKTLKGVEGGYQYILLDFVRGLPAEIRYINLEQDLGLLGLRQTKRSFGPVKLLEKNLVKVTRFYV